MNSRNCNGGAGKLTLHARRPNLGASFGRDRPMKLYNSIGPNPHVVRMFIAEKDLQIPAVSIDVLKGENRREPYLRLNPHGQLPALELDDGSSICEITAICEYLEDLHPSPPLIGSNPREKAECRMWTRRIDLNICEPLTNGFRFGEGTWVCSRTASSRYPRRRTV